MTEEAPNMLHPSERLSRALEPTPEEIEALSLDEVREELRKLGIDDNALKASVRGVAEMVHAVTEDPGMHLIPLGPHKLANDIEEAVADFSNPSPIFERVCREIELLGFKFAAIQLSRPDEDVIETVYGTGVATELAGFSRHYLERTPHLRDIQADIFRTGHTEIIAGWDPRFDPWIYKMFRHDRLIRVYTPIMIVRDKEGNIVDDWADYCAWTVTLDVRKEKSQHHAILKLQGKKHLAEVTYTEDQGYQIHLLDVSDHRCQTWNVEIIGTVEAGHDVSGDDGKLPEIGVQEAENLARIVARQALVIHRATLSCVLETIVERARQIVQADSASLYLDYNPTSNRYVYEVCRGRLGKQCLKTYPRPEGLGQKALQEKTPKLIPDPFVVSQELDLEKFNPETFAEGVRAMAAFPLITGSTQGILYVYFENDHEFSPDEVGWIQLLANRAVDAIRHAAAYKQMRDRTGQLMAVHRITLSLASMPSDSDLLQLIACNTLDVLAADIVTIYEYKQALNHFVCPPLIAGRLQDKRHVLADVDEYDAPALVVQHGQHVYAEISSANLILNNPAREHPADKSESFVKREGVCSSAGILLREGNWNDKEIVGVMFINYRRPHKFFKEEKEIIEILASSAAVALKNQRLLETFTAIDDDMPDTLDHEDRLTRLVQRAVELTGARQGSLLLLETDTQELAVRVIYSPDKSVAFDLSHLKVGEAVPGWAVARRQPVLVNNMQTDLQFRKYFRGIHSELCIPLLDRDNCVLGVLKLEHHEQGIFTLRHQKISQLLANQIVIAIRGEENVHNLYQED
jgi:GAF domain-containing protein